MTDLCPVTAAATSAAARTGLSLSGLREVVPGVELQGGDPVLRGVTHRSGAVRSGFLFAALPGARGHGASFAAEAVTRGAAAVLTDPAGMRLVRDAGVTVPLAVVDDPRLVLGVAAGAVLGDPGRDLALVGVTGTNGKTTTTYLGRRPRRRPVGTQARTGDTDPRRES